MKNPTIQQAEQSPRIRPARYGEVLKSTSQIDPATDCEASIDMIESTLPLVAEFGGRAVASVSLTLTAEHVAMIHGLWIDPAWVETTLPLRMVVAVLEQGRKLGCLKVDMDRGVRGLAVIAMLLDSGLLMDRSVSARGEEPAKAMSCYLNLYQDASSALT